MPEPFVLVDCCNPLGEAALSSDEAVELERVFKALADRHRLRILSILASTDEAVCVCEFQPQLQISQPTVSHHLKQLVDAGLLRREKRGTFAYYSLEPDVLEQIGTVLAPAATVGARGRSRAAVAV